MNLEERLSQRVREVPPSGIRKFFDIANSMKDAISLGIGEPDFITPWNVRKAAIRSLEKGHTQYTANSGIYELRKEISRYIEKRYGVTYSPDDQMVVTVGASEAIDLALRALVNPGDEVIVPDPSYVSYMPNIHLVGGTAVPVRITAEHQFRLQPEDLKKAITPKTKALILPYPNNPTGGIMEKADLEAIADVLRDTDIMVISDEIYSELTYKGHHVSFASLPGMYERTLYINGFSKAFAMTGWRLGYIAGAREIINAVYKIHQYVIMCAPITAQEAAIEALQTGMDTDFEDVVHMRQQYDMRRRFLVDQLPKMGLPVFEALGAFYVFPCITMTGLSSQEFAERLLMEQKVALVPGTAFGPSGEGFVRISYAMSMENIKEALVRINRFLEQFR